MCKTKPTKSIENLDPDKECKFPFVHKGTNFTKCTLVDHDGVYWCATDKNHDPSPKQGKLRSYKKWGACEEECPKHLSDGQDISLPENPMDNGKLHNIKRIDMHLWCIVLRVYIHGN